jgi:tRNA (cmo5U34)-methyltransferase
MKRDKIFIKTRKISDFKFDEEVSEAFDDMLERSIPLYKEMQKMAANFVRKYSTENSNIYDLGCSTGNTLINILRTIKKKNIKVIGIDSSTHMLKKAKEKIEKSYKGNGYELRHKDLDNPLDMKNASVVLMLLTLQFIKPSNREYLIKKIYESLNSNGCFILIEKVVSSHPQIENLFTEKYHQYKKKMGYSAEEIKNKKNSLKDILIPLSLEKNLSLLKESGFSWVDIFFKWYNFAGIIGIKK